MPIFFGYINLLPKELQKIKENAIVSIGIGIGTTIAKWHNCHNLESFFTLPVILPEISANVAG